MGVNKVVYGGKTLVDLTPSTVTSDTLLEGTIAFDAAGNKIVGTMTAGSGADVDVSALVPKVGDRGELAGWNACAIYEVTSTLDLTIDASSPDDIRVVVLEGGVVNLHFGNCFSSYVKNILLMIDGGSVNVTFGDGMIPDTFFQDFVLELPLGAYNQILVVAYGDETGGLGFVKNKIIL